MYVAQLKSYHSIHLFRYNARTIDSCHTIGTDDFLFYFFSIKTFRIHSKRTVVMDLNMFIRKCPNRKNGQIISYVFKSYTGWFR